METLPLKDLIKTPEFIAFYKAAENYCDFIEHYDAHNEQFLMAAQKHLFELYNVGKALQWVELESEINDDNETESNRRHDELRFIGERLGDCQYYWHVFDPSIENDTEPVCGDLTDDLGDIYKDLKQGLLMYGIDKEHIKESAVWDFKFFFERHWGEHCINAIYAIHYF